MKMRMHALLADSPSRRAEMENESGKREGFVANRPVMDILHTPKNLTGLRKASVDDVEIPMHGGRDSVSIDDRAPRSEVFGISNKKDAVAERRSRCGRAFRRPLRVVSKADGRQIPSEIPIRSHAWNCR